MKLMRKLRHVWWIVKVRNRKHTNKLKIVIKIKVIYL
jgi:hypothetical protein